MDEDDDSEINEAERDKILRDLENEDDDDDDEDDDADDSEN